MKRYWMCSALWFIMAIGCAVIMDVILAGEPRVTLGGELGQAASVCSARFRFAPFDSLSWLRADLTGETVSEFDDAPWGHVMKRPFKNFSGDISGRFLEIMALNSYGDALAHPAQAELLKQVQLYQRPGGYFCNSGEIDWQGPIDHPAKGEDALGGRMMPALWGNARLLCGLVESMRAFPNDIATARAACQLGDFYLSVLERFNDAERIGEYTAGGTYAAGYVTCWFPAMEGLVKLANLTGDKKYIDAAVKMAAFYQRFDQLPIDHAHGMLCCHVSLVLLFEMTSERAYLARVENRWDELVQGGYINPAGGILEKCRVKFGRDEGCAIVDWLRLNLELGRLTGKARYWDMAERTLHNHMLQNQSSKGGFGHRRILCDEDGAYGFGKDQEEATWCCDYHGQLGFSEIRRHLLLREEDVLSCRFALDFSVADSVGITTSVMRRGQEPSEVVRQRISLAGQPPSIIRVRRPQWADSVTAIDAIGAVVPLEIRGAWCVTHKPVTEVEFIYTGGVYAEDRRCVRLSDGPKSEGFYVLGYGPKLLAFDGVTAPVPTWPTTLEVLKKRGWQALGPERVGTDCCFVAGAGK